MKKYLFLSAAALAAIFAFNSCNKEIATIEPQEEGNIVALTINAYTPSETKAVIGDKVGDSYPVTWSDTGESFKLIEIADPDEEGDDKYHRYNINDYAVSSGNTTASFNVDLTEETTVGKYSYFAISPQASYSSIDVSTHNSFTIVVPTSQTPGPTTVDPAAIVLLGSVKNLDAQATSSLNMTFNHLTAYGKMTFKNVPAAIKAEGITSVSVSVPAGNSYYYYRTDGYTQSGTSSNQVSINTTNLDTSDDFTAWFACIPNSISDADIVFSITTSSDTYQRTIHVPSGKTLSFTKGHVSSFSVDMSSASATDLSGDYLIVSHDADNPWYIMPSTTNSSDLFVGVNTSVSGTTDIDVDDASTDFADFCRSDYVWKLAKYSGGYSLQNAYTGKYVTWSSGNTAALSDSPVPLQVTDNGDGTFAVKEGTLARALQFNYNSGNTRFVFYASTQKPTYFVKVASYKTVLPEPTISTSVSGMTITVNWDEVEHASSYAVTCTGQADKNIPYGTNTTSFTVASSGSFTVTVTAVGTGDYITSTAASEEVLVGSVISFSWSRSGTADTVTSGYSLLTTSVSGKSGYYQDKSGSEGLVISLKKSDDSALFTTTPTTISVTAKIGGGSTRATLVNNMMVCLVDDEQNEIAGTATVVTTKVEVTTGEDYTVTVPNVASAYGVKFYHEKEASYNIRIYSATVNITQ